MGTTIDNAFVQSYESNVIYLSRQEGSLLLPHVMVKDLKANKHYFERIGEAGIEQITSRHQKTPLSDIPHTRRMLSMKDFASATLIDDEDQVRTLIDPTNPYARAIADALGQQMDDEIIAAATGNAIASTTEDHTEANVALPAGQYVAKDLSGSDEHLTINKLLRARRIFEDNNVNLIRTPLTCVFNPEAKESLLKTTQITSADYNTVKALVNGEINSFLGMNFVTSTRLSGASTTGDPLLVLVFTKDAMGFGMGRDITSKITERDDLNYSTQVWSRFTGGATRVDDDKVVAIKCVSV